MANDMLIKALFLLSIPLTASISNQIPCSKNGTILLETTGDAILTVFVDANYGEYCNISSSKGRQQISMALHVVRTLNKYDHVPGVKLGLRVLDTCYDNITVFRRALQIILEQNYAAEYEMGVLVPSQYNLMVNALRDYGGLPISTYGEQNFTIPTIDILARYLSTKYEVVDLVYANVDFVLDRFLEVTRDAGVCVKRRDGYVDDDRSVNVTETVIVAIGERNDIQRWLEESEVSKGSRETWLLLPLDNSDIDDLVPSGSYIIKPETPDLSEFSSVDEFLGNSSGDSANRSPYLLGIGKAIVGLAEVLQDVRRRGNPTDKQDDDEGSCIVAQFRLQSQREIRDSDVYEALRMQPRLHSVRYAVAMKTQHELVDVALYGIEVSKLRVLPVRMTSGMPGLCLKNLTENCENCTNFQGYEFSDTRVITKADITESVLKNSVYVPIFLIAIVCGTLACCVTAIFIVHRFATEEMLDGNPTLTVVLTLANVFTLLTALPFCMTDDYFGAENLNARKILLTTLAFCFTFSIMLSRALFLALTTGDIFTHVNGYLQSIMTFFITSVQIAISVMYFFLNTIDSAVIARSPILISLLGYDIFLLIALFVASCFIIKIQRNYYEGKCFFSTAVGLLIVWAIWLICFMLMQPKNRDTIVCFGTIGTAYSIIFGVLIPRIYYMIIHPPRRKSLGQRFDPVDLPTDSMVNTIRQSRFSYDYVHPVQESQILRLPSTHPNYYSSPNPSLDRRKSPNHREMPTYCSNYRFQAEMKEVDCITPRICIENMEFLRNSKVAPSDVIYAQPRIYRSQRIILGEKNNAETTRIRDNSSPRLHDEMYPMRYSSPTNMVRENRIGEEDEDEDENEKDQEDQEDQESEGVSRVTRF